MASHRRRQVFLLRSPDSHKRPPAVFCGTGQSRIQKSCAFLNTNEPSVRPIPASWKRDLLGRGGPGWYAKEEAELLFFDPARHRGARDSKRASEATETASFEVG